MELEVISESIPTKKEKKKHHGKSKAAKVDVAEESKDDLWVPIPDDVVVIFWIFKYHYFSYIVR
jgi:hypothetical protein